MNRYLNRGANLFLLLLGMLCLCVLVRDSFLLVLPVTAFYELALLCLFLWVATSFRYGVFVGMPLSAALLWYVYQERSENLALELRDLMDRINAVYYGHYSGSAAAYVPEQFTGTHELAILLVFFVLSAFVAVSLSSGSFRVSLVTLATVPLFAVCVAVNGKPDILPILGLLAFWVGLKLSGDVFRPDDGAGKLLTFGLLPCLLVFLLMLLLYRPDTYEPSEYDLDLSQRFDKIGNALSEWLEQEPDATGEMDVQRPLSTTLPTATPIPVYRAPNAWADSGDDLDLTVPYDEAVLNNEVFRVSADVGGSVYLRGRSYGEYTGTSWTAAVENTHGNALSYTGSAIAARSDTSVYSFQLRSLLAYDVLYLPYYSIVEAENDVAVPSNGYDRYGGAFYLSEIGVDTLQNSVALPQELQADEAQYREFVHSYYTRLPESTRLALAEFCNARNLNASSGNLLWAVASLVRSQGTYDVHVGLYPSTDYAVWFLTQSHRGYCIHFATAAVALYRSLGIPARICEGYLVNNLSPGQTVKVTAQDAHAWPEVYLDGIGWIPVEVTASAAEEPQDQPSAGSVAPTPAPSYPEPDAEPSEADLLPDDSADESPLSINPGGAAEAGSSPDPGKFSPYRNGTVSYVFRMLCLFFLILAAVVSVLMIRYLILRSMIRASFRVSDSRRQAINQYRQASRIIRYGGEMPRQLLDTAEKARFSQHEISAEELRIGMELLTGLTKEVYSGLGRLKKLQFRFLSGNL